MYKKYVMRGRKGPKKQLITTPTYLKYSSLPASDPGSAAVWCSKRINPRPQSCLCLT